MLLCKNLLVYQSFRSYSITKRAVELFCIFKALPLYQQVSILIYCTHSIANQCCLYTRFQHYSHYWSPLWTIARPITKFSSILTPDSFFISDYFALFSLGLWLHKIISSFITLSGGFLHKNFMFFSVRSGQYRFHLFCETLLIIVFEYCYWTLVYNTFY